MKKREGNNRKKMKLRTKNRSSSGRTWNGTRTSNKETRDDEESRQFWDNLTVAPEAAITKRKRNGEEGEEEKKHEHTLTQSEMERIEDNTECAKRRKEMNVRRLTRPEKERIEDNKEGAR